MSYVKHSTKSAKLPNSHEMTEIENLYQHDRGKLLPNIQQDNIITSTKILN